MTDAIDWRAPFQLMSDIILASVGWILVLLVSYILISFTLTISKAFILTVIQIFTKSEKKPRKSRKIRVSE